MMNSKKRSSSAVPIRAHRHRAGHPHHAVHRSRWSRLLWIPVVVILLAVGWVGVRGLLAKAELEQAQGLIGQMKASAASFDLDAIGPLFDEVSAHSEAARSLTGDPVWRLVEFVPVLGRNLTVVRELAEVADETVDAIGPLAGLAGSLDPESLAPVDGAVPLQPFVDAAPLVQDAAARIDELQARARLIDPSYTIGPIADARTRVVNLLDSTAPALDTAGSLVPLLPGMLGADGIREYIVMFQNNAETRSLGGTALSFARITIDHGKISLVETVPAGFANFPMLGPSIVPVPDGFQDIYPGVYGTFIPNATLRPSFPSASEIVWANWNQFRGVQADGIISLDAVALSYVLRATGSVPLSTGDVLDSTNVVSILLNELLLRFDSGDVVADNVAQDAVYSEAVSQTFSRLSSGAFDVPTLLSAVFQGFTERRFSYWSADPDAEAAIADAGVANDLPESTEDTDAIGVFVNDYVGAKINYYLNPKTATASGMCAPGDLQIHRITYSLSNLIDPTGVSSLSPSILGEYKREHLAPGVQRLMIFVYAPPGSTFLQASLDGTAVELVPLHDTDRPVARIVMKIPPGETSTLSVDVEMSAPGERKLNLVTTPLIREGLESASKLDCSTVVSAK